MTKPATPLPIDRHFDCMKRCPMGCAKVCKRFAYPKLVEALRWQRDRVIATEPGLHRPAARQMVERANALLRSLGEEA